jgi:hypothetical protein
MHKSRIYKSKSSLLMASINKHGKQKHTISQDLERTLNNAKRIDEVEDIENSYYASLSSSKEKSSSGSTSNRRKKQKTQEFNLSFLEGILTKKL